MVKVQMTGQFAIAERRYGSNRILVSFVCAMWGLAIVVWSGRPLNRNQIEPAATGTQVQLNTADVDALCLLPGIGPRLAGRIVTFRDRVGGLKNLNQLLDVPGIGPVTLERIRPLVGCQPVAWRCRSTDAADTR